MNDGTKNRSVTITPSGIVEGPILTNTPDKKNSSFRFSVRKNQNFDIQMYSLELVIFSLATSGLWCVV